MTEKYPDLVALIPHIRAEGIESFIIEGEVVAVDDQGSVKTFQTLAGRGKKNVGLSEVKVQVCLYAFDLMYLNGEVRSQLRAFFSKLPFHCFIFSPAPFFWGLKDQTDLVEFTR